MDKYDQIAETNRILNDCYFDLRGLAAYSSLGTSTIRDYIKREALPCFKVRGKLLFKRSEVDQWLESFRVKDNEQIDRIVDEVFEGLGSRIHPKNGRAN